MEPSRMVVVYGLVTAYRERCALEVAQAEARYGVYAAATARRRERYLRVFQEDLFARVAEETSVGVFLPQPSFREIALARGLLSMDYPATRSLRETLAGVEGAPGCFNHGMRGGSWITQDRGVRGTRRTGGQGDVS